MMRRIPAVKRALPRRRTGTVSVAVLLLVLFGCGGQPGEHEGHDPEAGTQAPAAMDHAHHGLTASAGPGYTADDVHFLQMMMGHHDQALRMATLAPERDAGDEVLTLARTIEISQRDEIATMGRWLAERGQPVPDSAQMRSMEMPGMVTEAQFARLNEARGVEFDRLFLRYMIEHHLGAVDMVDNVFASPGSLQDSELFQLASDVGADQMDEIGIMERILSRIESTPAAPRETTP